ncbi:glycosyltransferase [Planococcus sp. CAU13]|uniref:glycosyltransferase n=1 Tax=Planococcus sp. CAU13 TaxID=1541197 RepID=UPI0005300887|nr:glycosyltransferase [Planococcus sp. CAU13]
MKIVLAAPNYPQPRGNTVTVRRIAANLEKIGVRTKIVSTTGDNQARSLPEADLVHGFHAYYFHQFLQQLEQKPDKYIVTMTGTDLNVDLFHPEKRTAVLSTLDCAEAIHVFDEAAKTTVLQEAPQFKGKIFAIAQGTSDFSPAHQSELQKEAGTFLFVLPAGIRKVKNIPFAIHALARLHEKYPNLRLWLAGPILEEAEAEIVLDLAEQHADWLTYIGEVPHAEMGTVFAHADVVLNTSHSEGQPAAILEAMGYGKPVLVSSVPGNKGMVENGRTGYLYNDENQFLDYAAELIDNSEARQRIGQQAKQYAADHHSPTLEAETLRQIYRSILE